MNITILALFIGFFLAMNIGASNTAASMSTAYGAGVRTRRQVVFLVAIFTALGALFVSGRVVTTLGKELIPEVYFTRSFGCVLIVMLVAVTFVGASNYFGSAVATTVAVVSAVAGVGIYYGNINWKRLLYVFSWEAASPLVSFGLNFWFAKRYYFPVLEWMTKRWPEPNIEHYLGNVLTATGCLVAFAAGSNNTANSVGPLVGGGILSLRISGVFAAVGMGTGVFFLSKRVLETMGKKIMDLGVLRSIVIQFIGGSIILVASLFGVPNSLNMSVAAGILGHACAQRGIKNTIDNEHVVRLLVFWTVTPFLAIALSYTLVALFIGN